MNTIRWIIAAVLAVAGVILGQRLAHERELDKERERAQDAQDAAMAAGDLLAAERAARRVADVDRELARSRQRSVAERAREAVAEARRRRTGRAAE